MTISQFEDKGKIFTPVIRKDDVPALIQTPTHKIQGKIHVRKDDRVKDELDRDEMYLAVTDARIFDLKSNLIYECNFISINKHQIIWIIPEDEGAPEYDQKNLREVNE